eukprot:TRINITY_DN22119_c0_g1_i1.p1 TRINITY_DN22119_c0_g1~~TRINITY_DN22119_c0_g1_i1.p1  ORF type:complete len:419 (-),score=-1.76 TRINITY_DN22119_c0_g1_i1:48-1304(-)
MLCATEVTRVPTDQFYLMLKELMSSLLDATNTLAHHQQRHCYAKALVDDLNQQQDEVVTLRIGPRKRAFSSTLTTLTRERDSMLWTWFGSGTWSSGREEIVPDRTPERFRDILEWLRGQEPCYERWWDHDPCDLSWWSLKGRAAEDRLEEVIDEAKFWGVSLLDKAATEELLTWEEWSRTTWTASWGYGGVKIENDARRIRNGDTRYRGYFVCEELPLFVGSRLELHMTVSGSHGSLHDLVIGWICSHNVNFDFLNKPGFQCVCALGKSSCSVSAKELPILSDTTVPYTLTLVGDRLRNLMIVRHNGREIARQVLEFARDVVFFPYCCLQSGHSVSVTLIKGFSPPPVARSGVVGQNTSSPKHPDMHHSLDNNQIRKLQPVPGTKLRTQDWVASQTNTLLHQPVVCTPNLLAHTAAGN